MYLWQGKATGVIRVMDELAIRLAADEETAPDFVIWDEAQQLFVRLDFTEMLIRRQHNHKLPASPKTETKAALNIPMRVGGFRVPLSRTARRLTARKVRPRAYPKSAVRFKPGSILFIPHGGVWSSKEYARTVLRLQAGKSIKLVPVVCDMCPVLCPQVCSKGVRSTFTSYMTKVLPKADLALCISRNTARDARKWARTLNVAGLPTKVFRLGDEIDGCEGVKPKGFRAARGFCLCVGTIEARKNHASLYYAYKLAKARNIKLPDLVIVGRKGWLADDIYEIMTTDPDTKHKLKFIHDASDEELIWLYKNADFTVYPSFYEGWGLPVAESLLHGVPCLASGTSSIPEIGGDLVDYFSPYSAEEIMIKMNRFASDRRLLESRRRRIDKDYRPTSWDDTYRQVLSALRGL